jgi:anti-sigma factor RsiW
MTIDETTLRAYVDAELSLSERERVDAALAHSAELRLQLEAMKASCLPYQAAFDAQPLPALPSALQKQLAAMSAVAVTSAPRRRWLSGAGGIFAGGMALAASFAAGLAIRPALFDQKPIDDVADWVKAIASYQALYVRDTVERATENDANAKQIIAEFQQQTKGVLLVPDLSNNGFEFKRIQRLAFSEQALVQMAYLPKQGKPAALCVMSAMGAMSTRKSQAALAVDASARRLENLSIVTWTRDQLSYVFAADMPLPDALNIGRSLAMGKFNILHKA